MGEAVDVLVVGAGPAGSTIARLLSEWGHSVLLLNGPPSRTPLIETLPPGIDEVFEKIGIRSAVAPRGFQRAFGSTCWWGTAEPQIDNYDKGGRGYHVNRRQFDDLLLELAERAGVKVQRNSRAPRIALSQGAIEPDIDLASTRFVVDASGRAGLVARQIRRCWDPRYATLALCGTFRAGDSAWDVDPQHRLIEAYHHGWAWSAPLDHQRRHVAFMVDSAVLRTDIEQAYRTELEKTRHFVTFFSGCELEGPVFTRDASLYYAERYAGPNWILVGDAGSFVDPVASSGVRKSLESAWMGALVADTCLRRPEMAEATIDGFNLRQRETRLDDSRAAAERFALGAATYTTSFWRDRAVLPDAVLSAGGQVI